MDHPSVIGRVAAAAVRAIRPALSTTRFLVTVMVPVSLAVLFLDRSGTLAFLAAWLQPCMRLLGLSGESSLVFLSGALLNNYSAIAVIGTLDLSGREVAILAVMCLICHNLIVECAVMRKTGSSVAKMVFLRLGTAVFAAAVLNRILPPEMGTAAAAGAAAGGTLAPAAFSSLLPAWAADSGLLILKIAIIVLGLMIAQKIMEEFGFMELLAKFTAPLMAVFGLPGSAGFLWIVSNVVGLAYGAGIMIERAESGKLSQSEGDLFNHHAGISHSLLEDTLLYAAIGVGAFWLIVPRVVLAIVIVWLERLRRILFRRSFRVGTI